MSLSTFIDVPELCTPSSVEAAQTLIDTVGELNDLNAYVLWMTQQLQTCSETVEMSIDQLIESKKPDLVKAMQAKQDNLNDLFTFGADEGEEKDAFEQRIHDEFVAHLDETGWDLIETGIVIPEVPELADDDTEEARDELIALDEELAYCETMTLWLEDEIFAPCDVLRQTYDAQITTESERLTASETQQMSLLATLKTLKDEEGTQSEEEFAVAMGKQYAEASAPQIDPEVEILDVPGVC